MVRGLAERLAHNRDRLRGMALGHGTDTETDTRKELAVEGVIGFQPLVLAMTARCAGCGRELEAGEQAFLGVRAGDGPRVLLGQECLPQTKRQGNKENRS
jgi:hypothetical protein